MPKLTLTHRGGMTLNAISLLTATGAANLLGLAFWAVASRLHQADDVGRASGELSALVLVASIAQLNLSNVFLRFLPSAGTKTRAIVGCSYLVVAALALLVAVAFVATGLGSSFLPAGLPARLQF